MTRALSARSRWYTGLLPTARQLVLWVASIVAVAIVSAYFASYFTRNDNLELAFKQQQLSDIQKFQTGATEVDARFRAFNDALVDQQGVEQAREAMRVAVARHASDAFALK